jgi:DNA-binding NtrC family response regulator
MIEVSSIRSVTDTLLRGCDWPGNVRELAAVAKLAVQWERFRPAI